MANRKIRIPTCFTNRVWCRPGSYFSDENTPQNTAGSIKRDEGNPHGSSSPQGAPRPPIPLGTKTKWGKIGAVGTTIGERYYWMVDKTGGVSMIPASTLEDMDGYIRENYESMA